MPGAIFWTCCDYCNADLTELWLPTQDSHKTKPHPPNPSVHRADDLQALSFTEELLAVDSC